MRTSLFVRTVDRPGLGAHVVGGFEGSHLAPRDASPDARGKRLDAVDEVAEQVVRLTDLQPRQTGEDLPEQRGHLGPRDDAAQAEVHAASAEGDVLGARP